MRGPHDKIVIAKSSSDEHGVYFTIGQESDSGSVIDFAQARLGGNIGQVRRRLRQWLGESRDLGSLAEARPTPRSLTRDQVAATVDARWQAMPIYAGPYLASRGLEPATIKAFGIRQDGHGNACMSHAGISGSVCGWEVKGRGFTGFSAGGVRSLAVGRLDAQQIQRVVVAESFIDVMSYAEMFHRSGDVYASTAGALGERQQEALTAVVGLEKGIALVAATDADDAGDAMALTLARLAPLRTVRHRPDRKDWNDVLLHRKSHDL